MRRKFKKICLVFVVCFLCLGFLCQDIVFAQDDPSEKILGFTLNNFDDKNNKTWDLAGETLEMFGDDIHLTQVNANVYGEKDNMNLVADTGTFNRVDGKVHLQDNVVITSESGAKMMTDTLDWLQKNQLVTTDDKVNIFRGNLEAEGLGAVGRTDLKQMSLKEEVKVDINPENEDDTMRKTTIICDGPLDIDYQKGSAVFNNNVEAFDGESQLFADKMTGYFDNESKEIVKVIAEGNVKMLRGKDKAYGKKAIYDAKTQQVSLVGRPKLVIYSQMDEKEGEEEGSKE